MKYIKLFENFEIVEPIPFGDPLNDVEIKILERYGVICPEFILKDDNYYYIHDHRCEKLKDVPLTYIHGVCSKFRIRHYTINDDYSIDVDADVNLAYNGFTKLPLKFNRVYGDFNCDANELTTLEGSPKEVGESFDCSENNLITLEGSPKEVGLFFFCSNNQLTTLQGGPVKVGSGFYCSSNNLTTLKGGPDYVGGNFWCKNNPLKSKKHKGIIKGKLIYS